MVAWSRDSSWDAVAVLRWRVVWRRGFETRKGDSRGTGSSGCRVFQENVDTEEEASREEGSARARCGGVQRAETKRGL